MTTQTPDDNSLSNVSGELKDFQKDTIKAFNSPNDEQAASQLSAVLADMEEHEAKRFRDGVRFGLRFAKISPDLVDAELENMESDHTPAAFSPPTTEGEDNLTQPSSGEQPTSVRGVFAELHGHNYHDEYSELAWEKWLTEAEQRVKTLVAEERRQAKIEILEELLDTRRPQVIGWEATIESYLTEFKELRGENNE